MIVIDEIPDNKIAISSPVGHSTELVRNHLVYDCPLSDDAMTWKHRECRYFAPRLKTGSMPILYEIVKVLIVDTDRLEDELSLSLLSPNEIKQIQDYVHDLSDTLVGGHRFYLLRENTKLKFSTPRREIVFPKKKENNTYTCYYFINDLKAKKEFPINLRQDQYSELGFYPSSL